jgi:5'-nucleotidase
MVNHHKPQILLTNDDGIGSPGLWAAARALSRLGFVSVVAPRDQASGSGRSMPPTSDGTIREDEIEVGGQRWHVFAVGGSPAQAVQHALLELMPTKPDLVVAGINYGENVTTSITISGTVGAAMEASSFGVPAMAVSLETDREHHLSYSELVDFEVAADFTRRFGAMLLAGLEFEDVDLLKVDVPSDATVETPWKIARLERTRYYLPRGPERDHLDQPGLVDYDVTNDPSDFTPGSDAYILRVERAVAVTPLSLDLTSRVDLGELARQFGSLEEEAGAPD